MFVYNMMNKIKHKQSKGEKMKNKNVCYFVSNGNVYSVWSEGGMLKNNMPGEKCFFIDNPNIPDLKSIRFEDGNSYALFDNLVQPMAMVSAQNRLHFINGDNVIGYYDYDKNQVSVGLAENIDQIGVRKNADGSESILFFDFNGSPMIAESYVLMSASDLTIHMSENGHNYLMAA